MEYKSYTLRNYNSIIQLKNLSIEQKEAIEVVGRVLPFKTNNYVVENLIDWNNIPADPIFTLTFPRADMLPKSDYNKIKKLLDENSSQSEIDLAVNKIRMKLNPNPAGQESNVPFLNKIKLKGVQHKYTETVLFFPSQGQTCHAYCTFCFRWPQFSGMNDLKFHMKDAELLYEYLEKHPKVTDVLFTGGDPMTMSANILSSYIEPLLTDRFPHIKNIRIGTKSLAYWPNRFTTDSDSSEIISLFKRIKAAGRNLSIQAHFSHTIELSTIQVRNATDAILSTGAQIRTQSPVLKHINDKPEIWASMWRKQVNMGMIPYYMFVVRDTGSRRFFELPLVRCSDIFNRAYSRVSGICRTVRGPSMSAKEGKIQVVGSANIKGEDVFILQFLQSPNPKIVNVPFFAKFDEDATWFDELKPAFNESSFFVEKQNT